MKFKVIIILLLTSVTLGDWYGYSDLDMLDYGIKNLGTLGAGAITGTSFTDGTTTISGGNYTGVGNITGTDVDISAGTGDYSSSGTLDSGTHTPVAGSDNLGGLSDFWNFIYAQRLYLTTTAYSVSKHGAANALSFMANSVEHLLYDTGLVMAVNTDVTLSGTGDIALGSGNISGSDLDISAGTGDYSSSGTGTFGNITIFNAIPILILKDSTYAGDVSLGYIEWRDSNNTRLGFFGNASSGNDDLFWKNESSGGHIKIETTGAGEVQIFADTVLNGTVGCGAITGTTIDLDPGGATDTQTNTLTGGNLYFYKYNPAAPGAVFQTRRARGTEADPCFLVANDTIFGFNAQAFNDDGVDDWSPNLAQFKVTANENHSAGNLGTNMQFKVNPDGAAGGASMVTALKLDGVGAYSGVNLYMEDDKLIAFDVNSGLTASTTQSQGQGALTAQVNEISIVANDGDTVTLPSAITGITTEIINNGAETLQIFPASGDDLGLGVNNAEELETNERVKFVAYDITNWAKESTTEIIHAEIHDEDNTDAFVINDAGGDFHSYHTNGLASGDLADWAFDAGGAGTSHAITSIADGVDSGNDIEITTGDNHLLAVGDIVSQTNLADAAYVGVFEVKAIISATQYEVAAAFTADGTGTMDQAATLEADAVAAGVYDFAYYISATPVGNNETFDFQLHKEATAITGSKIRRKFGAGGDFGSMSGGGVVPVANGDKISFALSNEDSSANLVIRNLTIVLIRL